MKQKQLDKLEAIRGISAIYVILHHILPPNLIYYGFNFSLFFKFGQEAVILFFLLSGFVIHYSFSKTSDKTFTTYLTKRCLRIYIPLIIVYIISFLAKSYESQHWVNINSLTLLGNLFMLQDLEILRPNSLCQPLFDNIPLWSLSYEFWFYMIYYFIQNKINASEQDKYVYFGVLIAAISYMIYPFFINRILMYFGIWWGGVVLAKSYINSKKVSLKNLYLHLAFIGIVSVILLVNIYILTGFKNIQIGVYPYGEARHYIFSFFAIVLGVFWQKMKWFSFNALVLPFAVFAKISYVLYILHYPLKFIIADLDEIPRIIIQNYFSYFLLVFSLSYFIETWLYPKLKKMLLSLKTPQYRTILNR